MHHCDLTADLNVPVSEQKL